MDKPSAVAVAEPEVQEDEGGFTVPADVLQTLLEIAKRRAELLACMKDALLREDFDKVKHIAEILCGLGHDTK